MKNYNGFEPVFPYTEASQDNSTGTTVFHQVIPGLTKREYFAAQALQGFIALRIRADFDIGKMSYENTAEWAVKQADALLAELEKKNENKD
jgi:hypothetical protein